VKANRLQELEREMIESLSFDDNKRRLYLKRSQELRERIEALGGRVQQGRYDDADLSELASILRSLRYDIAGNDTRLSEAVGLSGATISQTYSGKSRPKYANFMKMLYGAQQIVDKAVIDGGHQLAAINSLEGSPDEEAFNKRTSKSISIPPTKKGSRRSKDQRESITILIQNRVEIVKYSTAIIAALQEALDYKVERHHNLPPPVLRLDDENYLIELRNLVAELQRLNALLEKSTLSSAQAARRKVSSIEKHFDKFLSSYASALGKGAAGLTVAAAAGLLYQAGVGTDVINNLWQHLKRH
jgi:hypothetical protein